MQPSVLYVIDTLEVGGAERSTLEIAARLKGWRPVICQLYHGSTLLLDYAFNEDQIIRFDLKGPYQLHTASKKFCAVLDRVKPQLVVATLLRSELVARYCCRKKGIPIVGTFVNDTYSHHELQQADFSLRWKIRFFQVLNSITARWCVGFLSNSESIKTSNAVALRIPIEKIHVIPRGRKVPVKLPNSRAISFERPVICNVGRLIRRKGQLDLLKAFQLLLKDFPKAILRIAGEGPFRTELERYTRDNDLGNHVELCGTISDINTFYEKSDVAVFASYYEGFSGAVLEAALAGIPIVASDIPMNHEVLPDDGALFFPVMNVEELYRKMYQATTDRESACKRASKSFGFTSSCFDINAIASRHEAYYDSVMATLK